MTYQGWTIERAGKAWRITDPSGRISWEERTLKEAKRAIESERLMDQISFGD